jgi:phage terminase large subunit-like protein
VANARKLSQAELLQAQRELYTRSFRKFVEAAWSIIDPAPFIANWHIGVICDHLQAVAEGRCTRLLINVPPGSAKSSIVGVLFPAWLWARDPSKRIISAAHSLNLATRDSRKTRLLISSEWYQRLWPVELRDDENKKTAFENTSKGAREAMAFTSMTGSRGNIVIIDDPHSVKGAKSAAERASTVETFLEAVPTRLNNQERDAIIVIMQRLHEEDVSGAILSRPDLGYVHLCIPMIAEADATVNGLGWIDHREPGELMFPALFNAATIKKLKASMGPFVWAGQCQQRPAPANDGYFVRSWFNRYRPEQLPKKLNYYMTSDHAPGGKKTSDYNVVRIWGVDEKRNLWLVDSFRKQCMTDELIGVVRGADGRVELAQEGILPLIAKYRPYGWYPENDGTWTAINGFVRAAMLDTQVYCRIEPLALKGAGDKEGKAQAYQAMASMGMVYLPEGEVGDTALDEYVSFPVGKHDDQVDADGAIARVIAELMPAFIATSSSAGSRRRDFEPPLEAGSHSDLCW